VISEPPASTVVATDGLVKRYGSVTALDGVSLAVPAGSVYGLVGPNGAGKTTLLGILAGLRRPTSGSVRVDAEEIGVLPDTPTFDKWLTGREVVELAASLTGAPADRSAVVLRDAGLTAAADRRVGGYSRGMLQRLGLAGSVVGRPDLLLLDEPAAALDPAGRREVLDLITRLRGQATVVFSSHILDDVQEVSDHVGILAEGRLRYQGSLADLLVGERTRYRVELGTRAPERLVAALGRQRWVAEVRPVDDATFEVEVTDVDAAERSLVEVLARAEVPVRSIVPHRRSLEEVFLELTA